MDELVALYRETATHLSVVRARAAEPQLITELSGLVAEARSVIVGARDAGWAEIATFFTRRLPAALYRTRRWWGATLAANVAVMVAIGVWVATHPNVVASVAAPGEVQKLVSEDFANYYSEHPAADFAASVWTHNALTAAIALLLGIFFGIPTLIALWQNALNVGFIGGLMVANGRGGEFFGLITPHGLLELTAVFVAAGSGLRLGWTLLVPGPYRRGEALAREGRRAGVIALGLVVVLAVSGAIEAFVTPSPLPTWARIGIGAVAEMAFLGYALGLGALAAAREDAASGLVALAVDVTDSGPEVFAEAGRERLRVR